MDDARILRSYSATRALASTRAEPTPNDIDELIGEELRAIPTLNQNADSASGSQRERTPDLENQSYRQKRNEAYFNSNKNRRI